MLRPFVAYAGCCLWPVALVACGGAPEMGLTGSVRVFADRGARQCESAGVSLEASAQALTDAGITVLGSRCGLRTDMAFAAVCGGPTADIVLHDIPAADLPDAERIGFEDIGTLRGTDLGYVLVDCDDRRPRP